MQGSLTSLLGRSQCEMFGLDGMERGGEGITNIMRVIMYGRVGTLFTLPFPVSNVVSRFCSGLFSPLDVRSSKREHSSGCLLTIYCFGDLISRSRVLF